MDVIYLTPCEFEKKEGKYYKCTHPNYISWAKREGEENVMYGDSCDTVIKVGMKCPYKSGRLR
jgi:hypothetical protein